MSITAKIRVILVGIETSIKAVHAHCDAAGEHFNEAAHEAAKDLVVDAVEAFELAMEKAEELLNFDIYEVQRARRAAKREAEKLAAEALDNAIAEGKEPAPGTEAALLAGNSFIPGVDDAPKPGTAMAPGSGVAAINEPIIPEPTEGTLEIKGADAAEAVKELANEPINEALAAGAVAGAVPTPDENRAAGSDGSNTATTSPSPGDVAAADPKN